MKRRSLVRYRDAFLPLMGFIACVAGRMESAVGLLGTFLLVKACSLSADDAYERAVSDEFGAPMIARNQKTAFLMLLFGACASAAILYGVSIGTRVVPFAHMLTYWIAALWMMTCRFSAAFLSAKGEDGSAAMCEFLLSLLLAASMFLGDAGWQFGVKLNETQFLKDVRWDSPLFAAIGAAVIAILSAFVSGKLVKGAEKGSFLPSGKMFRRAPLAMAKGLLVPAIMVGMVAFGGVQALPLAFLGWAVNALGTSMYRRSRAETPALVAVMIPLAAVLTALISLPELKALGEVAQLKGFDVIVQALSVSVYGVCVAAVPIALSALVTLAINAWIAPWTGVAMALLAAQAAVACVELPEGIFSYTPALIGAIACACCIPMIREALLPARARAKRRAIGKKQRS